MASKSIVYFIKQLYICEDNGNNPHYVMFHATLGILLLKNKFNICASLEMENTPHFILQKLHWEM
jgi:hypothetical protein